MKNLTDLKRIVVDDDGFELRPRKSMKGVKKPWVLEAKTTFNFMLFFPDWYRLGKYETEEQAIQAYNDTLKKGLYKQTELRIRNKNA